MSEHTGLISSYQFRITAACTNTGDKMKGSHPRAADRCPFVPRHAKFGYLFHAVGNVMLGFCCRIWSWSPMPCEKHGPRESIFLSYFSFFIKTYLPRITHQPKSEVEGRHVMIGIIALLCWFSRDELPVTCYEHGPPSIATAHFSKFSIASKILFN